MSSLHAHRFSAAGIREHEDAHHPRSEINVGEVERWTSTIAGTLLVAHGLRRANFGGLALALIGGGLIYRGVTGHSEIYQALHIDTSDKHQARETGHIHQGILVKHSVTINRSAEDLYRAWRDVEAAPRFMAQVESVRKTGDNTSHWVVFGPFGKPIEWDSEIINDDPNRLIAWKTLPGAAGDHAGTIRFEPAPGGRGTVVTLELNYEPPAGVLGLTVARALGRDPSRIALENLRHFKQLMEAGEIPTIEGQPSGRGVAHQVATPLPPQA